MLNILIVEDEKRLADALKQIFTEQDYCVDTVYNGADGYYYVQNGNYDIIILDVMLPNLDGLEIVRKMRQEGNSTPVLMLTAKDETQNKVAGLDSGADDYMTKPFVTEELLARVRALTRRQGEVVFEKVTAFDVSLILSEHELCCGEKRIHLAKKEFDVMKILMSNPKRIIEKESLIIKLWGTESDADPNNIEAYISLLRKKLFYLNSTAEINTIRKVGYRLEDKND